MSHVHPLSLDGHCLPFLDGHLRQIQDRYHRTCGQRHPEFCAHTDSDILPLVEDIAKSLRRYLSKSQTGSFHWLRFSSEDPEECSISTWICQGYRRGHNPQIAIVHPCVLEDGVLQIDDGGQPERTQNIKYIKAKTRNSTLGVSMLRIEHRYQLSVISLLIVKLLIFE